VPCHEIAWLHPAVDASERYQIGDRLQVRIMQIDTAKARVSASLRQASSHPLRDGLVREGMTFVGTVFRFKPFGAFVMLPNGLVGLLHQSRIFSRKIRGYYPSVKSVLNLDQSVDVRVVSIDRQQERIELSLENGPFKI